jgi:predicted dienelactone hydrolase
MVLRRAVLASVLGLALAAGPAVAVAPPVVTETTPAGLGDRPAPVRLTLPEPTGPLRIGTVSFHLIDRSRRDPWAPDRSSRELMIQVWYPAQRTAGHPRAPWLSPKIAQAVMAGLPAGSVRLPLTHGRSGAPAHRGRARPVLLFSHGFGADRASGTALVEDLASHGYLVVTIDHTYDAGAVEFPGGQVRMHAASSPPPDFDRQDDPVATKAVAVRLADTRFVMDRLAALNRGQVVDAGGRPSPEGLRGALDMSRVGMFGHSLGGATAAAMHADSRVKAGVNLDGAMFGPVLREGLDRPFLLVGSAGHDRANDPGWAALWTRLRGWRLELRLDGTGHSSFTDLQVLLRQHPMGLSPGQVTELIGTIDGPRSVLIQRAYLRAFFDRHLLGRESPLLAKPSARWPEMRFVP